MPSAANWRRSSTLLTTLPLCAPTMSPSESRWGWELACEGLPKVAQRSCTIPRVPGISAKLCRSATASTLPTSLRRSIVAVRVDRRRADRVIAPVRKTPPGIRQDFAERLFVISDNAENAAHSRLVVEWDDVQEYSRAAMCE